MRGLLAFYALSLVMASTETKDTAVSDPADWPCGSEELEGEDAKTVMDGKCLRAYYRVDAFGAIEQAEQFEYLLENYCANLQTQPISCSQFKSRKKFDDLALEQYRELYKRYKEGGDQAPTVDCLGIARTVFCSYQFNYCDPDTGKEKDHAICTFLCDNWADRCPLESEIKDLVCRNSADDQCADARRNWLVVLAVLMVINYL